MATFRAAVAFHLVYGAIAVVHLAVRLDTRPDFQMIELPTMFKLAEAVRRGALHYWDPGILGGLPLFGSGMYPIFNPYNLLLLVMSPEVVFVLLPSLLRALGATGAFHCLHRRLGLGAPASLFGGMLYSTLSVVDDHVFLDYWAVHVIPALLPWLQSLLLAGVERRRPTVGVTAGILLALMFYAGGLHFLPYVVTFFVVTVVTLPFLAEESERPSPRFALTVLTLALAVFLGLAAFQLLPTLEFVREAIRTDYNPAVINDYLLRAAVGRLVFDFLPLVRFKLSPPYLAAVNVIGWLALLLLAAALRLHATRTIAPPWFRFHVRLAVLLVVGDVLYELGRLVPTLRALPVYGLSVQYALFVGDFLRAVLLAVGFEALFGSPHRTPQLSARWIAVWAWMRPLLLAAALAFPFALLVLYGPSCPLLERVLPALQGRHRTTEFLRAFCVSLPPSYWVLAVLMAVLQAAWLFRLRPARTGGTLTALLMLSVVGAYGTLAIANTNFLRGLPFHEVVEHTQEARFMQAQPPPTRYLVECRFGDQRNDSFHSFCGEVLWMVGARQWGGLEPLTPRRLMQTLRALGGDAPDFSFTIAFIGPVDVHSYDWLAHDYALTYRPLAHRAGQYDLVLRGDRYHIYRPRQPTPPVALYGRYEVEPETSRRLALLAASHPATREAVILDAPPPTPLPAGGGRPPLTYAVLADHQEEVRVRVDAGTAGILVFNANHYPGWRAWVDGAPVPVFYANHFMRGIVVPAGQHEVVYRFVSTSVRIGSLVTLGTAALLLVALAMRRRRRERAR